MTTAERRRALPDVPTIAESYPGFDVIGWIGIGAPQGTPAEIVRRLNGEINAALGDPKIAARFTDLGTDLFISSPEQFAKFIVEDVDQWSRVVKAAGLKLE